MELICRNCNESNPEDAFFCGECGISLNSDVTSVELKDFKLYNNENEKSNYTDSKSVDISPESETTEIETAENTFYDNKNDQPNNTNPVLNTPPEIETAENTFYDNKNDQPNNTNPTSIDILPEIEPFENKINTASFDNKNNQSNNTNPSSGNTPPKSNPSENKTAATAAETKNKQPLQTPKIARKKTNKKLVITFAVLILIIGGGYVCWNYVKIPSRNNEFTTYSAATILDSYCSEHSKMEKVAGGGLIGIISSGAIIGNARSEFHIDCKDLTIDSDDMNITSYVKEISAEAEVVIKNKISNSSQKTLTKQKINFIYDGKKWKIVENENLNTLLVEFIGYAAIKTQQSNEIKDENKKVNEPIKSSVVYKVQLFSSSKKIPLNSTKLKNVQNPGVYIDKGVYKYTAGEFTNEQDAKQLQSQLRLKGFKDAFVITMQGGKRITLNSQLSADTKILTLMNPTYSLGDLPHLTFKDFTTHKEEEYECNWDLPAIKEIMTKCEGNDGCPALKGKVYTATLKLKLLDAVEYDGESGGMKSTGKKEKRWILIALEKNKP